jgi:FkbM family methyltransferase
MLSNIINALPEITIAHACTTNTYQFLATIAKREIRTTDLMESRAGEVRLAGFGEIKLPYYKMGAVDTLDLFGLDELIIFSFYLKNRSRYKVAADIGANIGLHSILMSKLGWQVSAYEPDPIHAELLRRNLKLNDISGVQLFEAAVSDKAGTVEFVRVVGNTTGSHLAGAKANPYGKLERFPVNVVSMESVMSSADFIKLDAEGQEKVIILSTNSDSWKNTDMMVEVGSVENAQSIFDHLNALGIGCFSQKLGWRRVTSLSGMPANHKEGSLFISAKTEMPWVD